MQSRLATFLAGTAVVGAVLVAAGALYFWKFYFGPPPAPPFDMVESVQIETARQAKWHATSRLFGSVIAIQSVTVSNELAGVATDVKFESGSVVNKGDVLLTQDTTTELADLAAAEANVRMAQAGAESIAADIRWFQYSVRRLENMDGEVVAPSEFENTRSQLESAQAKLDRARAEIDQSKARVAQLQTTIAKKTIRAPFAARAGLRNVHPGQYLAEGAQIVMLQSIDEDIYIDFAIPQEYASMVHTGTVVMGSTPMLGEKPIAIEVVAMDASADYTTRNIRVRSKVANKEQKLRPGMFVDVTVPVGPDQDYVVVPATAVRRASFGDHVFAVVPDPKDPGKFTAQQRFIKLGPSVGPDVIVLEGIRAGEEIAAGGSFKLRNDVHVAKLPPGGAPAGAPTAKADSAGL